MSVGRDEWRGGTAVGEPPGNRRNPSPGSRSGPQTKQVGKGCDNKSAVRADADTRFGRTTPAGRLIGRPSVARSASATSSAPA